jgi:magnesium transporter
MINAYSISDGLLQRLDCSDDSVGLIGATWIDLIEPTDEQERTVETLLHVNIPTKEEVRTIDESSQAYREGNALVMTARVISKSETSNIRLVSVTFILIGKTLITLRYGDPTPFRTFVTRAEKEAAKLASGETVMVGLLETIVDRAAEILQTVGDELETLSTDIFTRDGSVSGSGNRADLRPTLQKIGRNGDLANRVQLSLHSLARITPYLLSNKTQEPTEDIADRLSTVSNDILSLLNHDGHVMSSVTFLLDATLGLINIQQNAIIKIFSVAAVIFLPPTLIASIYGMNFEHMPELKWMAGYPFAIMLMIASAVLPYLYFKRRGWL